MVEFRRHTKLCHKANLATSEILKANAVIEDILEVEYSHCTSVHVEFKTSALFATTNSFERMNEMMGADSYIFKFFRRRLMITFTYDKK